MSHFTSHVTDCICIHALTIGSIVYNLLLMLLFSGFFTYIVELNEVGFKFVRKCINYIETKGKGGPFFGFVSSPPRPEGGVVES